MTDITNQIITFLDVNKAITKIDEILAEFPDYTFEELNKTEILKILENNKIKMQTALKIKLFKANTTDSLLKLNAMLEKETNDDRISNYIDEVVERWKNEL